MKDNQWTTVRLGRSVGMAAREQIPKVMRMPCQLAHMYAEQGVVGLEYDAAIVEPEIRMPLESTVHGSAWRMCGLSGGIG